MFGDVPDPTVTTARVGSRAAFGRTREEGLGLTREVRLGLAVSGSGLCRKPRAERREERQTRRLFPETENVQRLTDYNVAIVNHWGIRRTPNAIKFGRRPTDNIKRPHANSHPIPRTSSGHL